MYTNREHDEIIDGYESKLTENNNLITDQQAEIESLRQHDAVWRFAGEVLAQVETREISIDAESDAKKIVAKRIRNMKTAGITNRLLDERETLYEQEFDEDDEAALTVEIDADLEESEQYAQLRIDVAARRAAATRERLIAQATTDAEAALTEPEYVDSEIAGIQAQLVTDGVPDHIKAELREKMIPEWTAQAQAKITAEIEAEKPTYRAEWEDEYRKGYQGIRFTERTRQEYQSTWADKSSAEVAEAISDEELKTYLTDRAEREKAAEAKIAEYDNHLSAFDAAGIDTSAIPKDTKLTIMLGTTESEMVTEYDANGHYTGKQVPQYTIDCVRQISAVAVGDEKFVINSDTLAAAQDRYSANDAFAAGTVVALGRVMFDGDSESLDPHITQGVNLRVDTDARDLESTDTHYPVANVLMNQQSALKGKVVVNLPGAKKR